MATRDEILNELGLGPRWRLRARATTATASAAEADGDVMLRERDTTAAARSADSTQGRPTPQPSVPMARREPAPTQPEADPRVIRIATLDWPELVSDIAGCTACGLSRTRRKTVPGVGDVKADWMFIGEAPGAEEDAQGEPFVGQAGRLLDSMLAAIDLARGRNVYIANVLKCRPPANRTPEPGEVDACKAYLDRQIDLVRPKLIVALGKSAAVTLLGSESSIASLRGRLHRYRGIPLLVTYHPAYLLRNLPDKAKSWEDLLLARRTVQAAAAEAQR
jgi:DNA polymerase